LLPTPEKTVNNSYLGVCDLEPKEMLKQFILTKLISNDHDVEIEYETNLLRTGLIDSMALMTLVNFIESEFDVEIPFTDFTVMNFHSINAMTNYIEKRKHN
jgi:acyl carrier protein